MALLRLNRGNIMECKKKITKSDVNFKPTFADHHLLPGIKVNGHCLIKNNVYFPKKVINLYICLTH